MEPATVNSFLDRFIALSDSAFGLIEGDVVYVLNALIAISIVMAGLRWALAEEAAMAPFFRKILFIGFFAFLINNWNALVGAINESGAMLGLRAGGDGLTLAELHDPGRVAWIGIEMFGKTIELSEGMNLFSDGMAMAAILIAALTAALGFFVLALQLFITLIAFKVGALTAFIALPWGVFSGTAFIAERPLGWVAASAVRLFVLAFVASVALTFVETLPENFVLEDGGALAILFFGFTMLALSWFAPQLASEVVNGQPNLAAPHVAAVALAGAHVGAGAARGAFKLAGAGIGAAWAVGRFAVGAGAGLVRASRRFGRTASTNVDHSRLQPPPRSRP